MENFKKKKKNTTLKRITPKKGLKNTMIHQPKVELQERIKNWERKKITNL